MSNAQNTQIHLLIVDDDLDGAMVLGELLTERFGFQVDYAETGLAAIAQITADPHTFNVVLIDQNLDATMDGIETMREIFRLNALLPVLLFTGYELQQEYVRAIASGAYLYLHLQKGQVSIEQLGFHCSAAVHDRVARWQALFQEMTQALHSLDEERVQETCERGLARLGYTRGAIYRYVPGWVVTDRLIAPGLRQIEQHWYLRCEHHFPGSMPDQPDNAAVNGCIDHLQAVGENMLVECDPDGHERITIPLRGEGMAGPAGTNLLGLLVLHHLPNHALEPREETSLKSLGQHLALALQNALAYRQLEYQRAATAEILRANHQIRVLDHGPDRQQDILDQFAQAMASAFGFGCVLIALINEARNVIEVGGLSGMDEQIRTHCWNRTEMERLHRTEYQHGTCFFLPEACYATDAYAGAAFAGPWYPAQPWEWHAGDILCVQIINSHGVVLGYIIVSQREHRRRPDENTFKALELFATQVAVAVENLSYQRTIQVIQQVGIEISRTQDCAVLFTTAHQQLQRLMYAEVIMIARYHPDRATAEQVEVVYRNRVVASERDLPTYRSVMAGLSGYVLRTGEPLLFAQKGEIRAFHRQHGLQPLGKPASSWMGVPLKVNANVIGVIALKDYKRQGTYTEHDLLLLTILADQIAVAWRRIELEQERMDANLRAITEVGVADKPERSERHILKWACEQTRADYGMILHYDEQEDSLIFSEGYVHKTGVEPKVNFTPGLRLPVNPRPGEPASLSAQVARERQPQRWGDVRKEPDYLEVLGTSRAQLSLPLIKRTEGEPEKLLGVVTLESSQLNAFDALPSDFLLALSTSATLASWGVKELNRYRSLLFWKIQDLSSDISRHRYVTDARNLLHRLETVNAQFQQLIGDLIPLRDAAAQIQPAEEIYLRQRHPVSLNQVVREFVTSYAQLYTHPKVTIDYLLNLADEQVVLAYAPGLREALKILVDNAFDVLIKTPYGGQICITTDINGTGLLLQVFNSGPALQAAELALTQADLTELQGDDRSLVQLRYLLQLYDAALAVTQNDGNGVEFTIHFAATPTRPAPPTIESHQLWRLQRTIVSQSALMFARIVNTRAPILEDLLETFRIALEQIQHSVETLTTHIDAKLDTQEPLVMNKLLEDFVNDVCKQQHVRVHAIQIQYTPRFHEPILVRANRIGIRHVLNILVDNALRAIAQRTTRDDGSAVITIQAEADGGWVKIHVQNTGSWIPPETANQLFEYRIESSHGRGLGLMLSRELLANYRGTIRLTLNDPVQGVKFTIELPHYTEEQVA